MMKPYSYFILVVTLALTAIGCKQPTEEQPYTGAIPGNISGRIMLRSAFGSANADNSGATLTLEPAGYTTQSDKDGVYTFENVNPGTYNLAFSKEGFGNDKLYGLRYTGGPATYYIEYPTVLNLNAAFPGSVTTPVVAQANSFPDGKIYYTINFYYTNPALDTTLYNYFYAKFYVGKDASISVNAYETMASDYVQARPKDGLCSASIALPASLVASGARYVQMYLGNGNFMTDPFGITTYGGGLLEAPDVLVLP